MKINRIDIGAFGKLEDFTLLLREGIQVFYGENEEGKSTIMAFISMMFYSKQENSQDIFRNPRRKYMPWSGRTMEGSISFLWENQEYHLSKQFADTPSKDIVTLTNLTLGQPISLGKEEVGEYFFGFNLSTFQRSSFIGQIGPVATGKKGMEEISDKLIYNLLTTANEHTSQQEVFSRLEKAKYELKSKREDRGLLVDAQQDLFTLLRKLKDVEEEIENQQEAQNKYHLLMEQHQYKQTLEKKVDAYNRATATLQLEELAQNLQQQQLIEKDLYQEKFSQETFEAFFLELEEKEKDITALTEEIDTLNRVNYQNTSSPWISQDEFDYFSSLESLFSEQKKGLDYWQQQLYPSIKNYEKTLFAYEQTLHDIQTYQEIWENEQQLLTKKNDLQKKEEALSIQLENHRVLTQEQRLLRDQQLVLLQERISPIAPEKKQFSLFLFSIGLFSALLFAVLFSFSSLWGLGWVFSFLLIFSSFFPFKSISQPSSERETSTFDKAKKEKDQWLLSTKAQEQRLLLALEEIRQQLESLAIQQEQAPLTEEIPSLKHRLSLFHEEAGGLLGNLNHGKEHIQHHLSLLKSTFPSLHVFLFPFEFEEDSEKIQQIIADELDNTKEEMEDFLSQKNLLSAKDFHQAFVASQSELNHQNALQERKKLLTEKEKAFLLFLSTYTPVENMAHGLTLFSYFQENLFLLKELKKTITLQGRALQISPLTLENVENRLLEQGSFKAEEPQEDIMLLKEKLYALQEVDYVMELSHLRSLLTIPTQSPQTLEKAIAIQKEKIKKMEDYYQALTLALQAMEKANERMRTHFSPLLNQKTSVIFAKITGNVNATLTIDKDYDFHIKKGLHYKPWGYLSQGTIDQGYFSLRIAISELITGPEKPPLFLDDPFIQYDSNREERALVFLKRHAFTTPLQVILFTSNGHSLALAKEKNIPVFRLSS